MNKQKQKTIIHWLISVICVLIALWIGTVLFYSDAFKKNNSKDTSKSSENDVSSNDETIKAKKQQLKNVAASTLAAENYINEETEFYVKTVVRPKYTEITENSNLTEKSNGKGKTMYYDETGTLCKIIYAKGYDSISYERRYYYDDNENLIFAFVTDYPIEHRFYFSNDKLVRYISPDKITNDNPTGKDVLDMSRRYIKEAYLP